MRITPRVAAVRSSLHPTFSLPAKFSIFMWASRVDTAPTTEQEEEGALSLSWAVPEYCSWPLGAAVVQATRTTALRPHWERRECRVQGAIPIPDLATAR